MEILRERKLEIINEYLNTPELERSLTKLGKKWGVKRQTISKWLYDAGIEVINYQNRSRIDESVFDIIDTEEKAYWLGFLYADGNISKHGNRFEMNLSIQDLNHMEKFKEFLKFEGKIRITRHHSDKNNICNISIRNAHMWTQLNDKGCIPAKSFNIKFPNESVLPKQLIPHFIRGYIDGDGWLYTSNNNTFVGVCSGSKDFILSIQTMFGGNLSERYYAPSGNYTFVLRWPQLKSRMIARYLYENASIYLERKYLIYKEFCRLEQECSKMSSSKIGEGWNVNPEVISDISQGSETP